MSLILLPVVSGVILVWLSAVIIGNVVKSIYRIVSRHIVFVVMQCGFCFSDKIGFLNRTVIVFLDIKVRQYGNRADFCILQKPFAVDVFIVHGVADVL